MKIELGKKCCETSISPLPLRSGVSVLLFALCLYGAQRFEVPVFGPVFGVFLGSLEGAQRGDWKKSGGGCWFTNHGGATVLPMNTNPVPSNFNWAAVVDAGSDRLLADIEADIVEVLLERWPTIEAPWELAAVIAHGIDGQGPFQFTVGSLAAAAVVAAIRADDVIGVGTCSVIDECYDGDDLIVLLNDHNSDKWCRLAVTTPAEAVQHFRFTHEIFHDVADDVMETGNW